jgi:uncharacterized membrane protein
MNMSATNPMPTAPGPAVRRAVSLLYGLTLAGTLAWLGAIFLAPFLGSRSAGRAAACLYAFFAPLCHQIPARSFAFCGQPLAVCARCLGIYAGFLAGLALYPFVRGFSKLSVPSGRLFLLLSLPIGLDYAGGFIGAWASPMGVRFATGLLWGSLLPFYFLTGLGELALRHAARKSRPARPGGDAAKGLANSARKNVQ